MRYHPIIRSLAVIFTVAMASCTEQIQFGNSFLEKAPGGDVPADTVFNSAEYTQQFLTGIYALQYYGLPYKAGDGNSHSYFSGQIEGMSDCWHVPTSAVGGLYNNIYNGFLQASKGNSVYGFTEEENWTLIRRAWMLIEHVDQVPGLDESTKARYQAEAKCLIASTYFNMLRFYGGLPLVTHSYQVNGDLHDTNRASVEKTVNFIIQLFDEAINSQAMPWTYSADEASTMTAHWTTAAAMAMKCKVLQYAASPLFNDSQPYYQGKYTMESAAQDSMVWYGGYHKELWQQCKKACEDFLSRNEAEGEPYHLVMPTAKTQEAYRYAFRHAYLDQSSPEVLFSTRVTDNNHNSRYTWPSRQYMRTNERYAYNPTEEYIEMFPWADGKPFNWDETEKKGELDHIFIKGSFNKSKQELQNIVYTRDPRLYETACCNGQRGIIQYANGNTSGQIVETYLGGTDAGKAPETGTGCFGNGYFHNKYIADGPKGSVYERKAPQWVVVRMSDIYLTYAEALLQADGNNTKAIEYVDKVRARVGLGDIASCNPTENLKTDKEQLLEEILRERACELGFENTRFFDMQRYKRADLFSRTLHRLVIHRMVKDDSGNWVTTTNKWYDGDRRTAKKGTAAWYEPSHFTYERPAITVGARVWWEGFDVKWYLFPFPQSEVLKGYLVQNPGW